MKQKEKLIQVSLDCPVNKGTIPFAKKNRNCKTLAMFMYQILIEAPYKYTEYEFYKELKRRKKSKTMKPKTWSLTRNELAKNWGWGVHINQKGKIAIVGCHTQKYKKLEKDINIKKARVSNKKKHNSRITRNILEDLEICRSKYEDENLSETEREAIRYSRIGQGKFRDYVMKFWKKCCAVTGCTALELLEASHIKPWKDSDNKECLDGFNGLLLVPNLHSALDKGLITFQDNGKIKISKRLSSSEAEKLGINSDMKISNVQAEHEKYLKYHRDKYFLE